MKITDEVKEFSSTHRFGTDRLVVSSNHPGEHTTPSLFLGVLDPATGREATFGTKDTEQIKEIIEHMAKMAGLTVTIGAPEPGEFVPKYQPGDRVRSLMPDSLSPLGTVLHDKPQVAGWNVRVMLDGDTFPGLYTYDELEPVTKNA